jgi:IS1 family transposase
MRLGARVGRGCAELHDRMMVGLRVGRLELDELWSFVGKKQKQMTRHDPAVLGDQYTFVALASSTRAIVAYHTGKRDSENTDLFIQDLRQRVLGLPEISSDGFKPYQPAIRDAFGNRVAHGIVAKTYSVTHLNVNEAARRYSPAAVIAVSHDVVSGIPAEISTSYAERQNLSLRMSQRRFTRLTNAFSKKVENHAAAVSLYVAHYNLCRVHEALTPSAKHQNTPAMALGLTTQPWSLGELLDAALAVAPADPTITAPERRRRLRVIEGGKN